MLSRVGVALHKFLSPLVSAPKQEKRAKSDPGEEQKQEKSKKPPEPEVEKAKSEALENQEAPASEPFRSSVSLSLLNMIDKIKDYRKQIIRVAGNDAYRSSNRNSKKGTRSLRGAMMDEKIE